MRQIELAERSVGDPNDRPSRRRLTEDLSTSELAINHYRLPAGESLPGGLHAHMDQEEVFVVLEGEATFETLEETLRVGRWEAIKFAPGEFQTGRNDGDEPLEVLALGAPRDTEDVRLPAPCPVCDHENVRLDTTGDRPTFVCPRCEAVHVPEPCPACDGADLRFRRGEIRSTIVVCGDCGHEMVDPPVHGVS